MTEALSAMTKMCVIVGDPVKHSLSPAMHNAAYAALGLEGSFVYLAAEVKRGDLARCVDGVRSMGIRGLTCTIPHKSDILPLIDVIDEAVEAIGAANSIVQDESGRLSGHNTDWLGVVDPLSEVTSLEGKRAAVIGAGGTARAAIYGLQQRGIGEIAILNRTLSRAKGLAEEFAAGGMCRAYALGEDAVIRDCDVIVQTTSVGMAPDVERSPVEASCWRKGQVVIEAIYRPHHTRLLRDAKEAGAIVLPGEAMLLAQGVAQFSLYTGVKAPIDAMRQVLLAQR